MMTPFPNCGCLTREPIPKIVSGINMICQQSEDPTLNPSPTREGLITRSLGGEGVRGMGLFIPDAPHREPCIFIVGADAHIFGAMGKQYIAGNGIIDFSG